MIRVRVQVKPFDVGAELAVLAALGGGAVASFTGIVRADGDVVAIELEHYPAMTHAALTELSEAAVVRWDLLGTIIIHRTGRLALGENVVLVATAAAHRSAALEAAAFLIDRLKTEAPFWKKEHRADGSADWVATKDSDNAAAARW